MEPIRNMGEQPLAQLLRELNLTPAHLVKASSEQLNHKMVSRGIKGRRLTGNVMKKIRNALNATGEKSYKVSDLFNYAPLDAKPSE